MQDDLFPPTESLAEARDRFLERIWSSGSVECPCCGRSAKVYVQRLNEGMLKTLVWLYCHAKDDYVHLPTVAPRHVLTSNSVGKLEVWRLTQRKPNLDDPTKHHVGWWRITARGRAFIEGRLTVPEAYYSYNKTVLGWRRNPWTVSDAHGRPFDYTKLMQEAAK